MFRKIFPFTAIVGQEKVKQALLLNVINPRIGGVLLRGEKGTAKSTMVRSLAQLLPEVEVVKGCPYFCDPNDVEMMCDNCRSNFGSLEVAKKKVRVVTLPLNATEDRVVGGIDFELAIRRGVRRISPGLLAKANRSILYIDEVNLLDDHIVDIILDAAASGKNRIEREGISFEHPASFVLVGTMNPEEGELRPQLLDRFGLSVHVTGEVDPEVRVELMVRREAFDSDPVGFVEKYSEDSRLLAKKIVSCRQNLSKVVFPRHLRKFVSELCKENFVAGHRADLVMEQSARAYAVFDGHFRVTTDDVTAVSQLVLSHRKRDVTPPPPKSQNPDKDSTRSENQDEKKEESEITAKDASGDSTTRSEDVKNTDSTGSQGESMDTSKKASDLSKREPDETVFEIGRTFSVKSITSSKDRTYRRGSGRRSRTRVSTKQGRYTKSTSVHLTGDIAIDATLRAAAPHQKKRNRTSGLAMVLMTGDIREKIREKKVGNFLLFVVDASGSMGARGRMIASKAAIMSLLLDAYQKRDKVAMISFRRKDAVVNLPPTSSVELASKLLAEMPVGGRTPLSAGLVSAHREISKFLLKDPLSRPIVLIITDGKTNVAIGEKKPVEEALDIARKMTRETRVTFIVVDTEESGVVTFGLSRELARALNARYFKMEDLKIEQPDEHSVSHIGKAGYSTLSARLVEIVKETR